MRGIEGLGVPRSAFVVIMVRVLNVGNGGVILVVVLVNVIAKVDPEVELFEGGCGVVTAAGGGGVAA